MTFDSPAGGGPVAVESVGGPGDNVALVPVPVGANRFVLAKWGLGSNYVLVTIALVVLVVATICAIRPSLFVSQPPLGINGNAISQGPSLHELLGTDQYGRGILPQLVYGAKDAMLIGSVSVLLALIVGGFIGFVSGYLGGWVDLLFMRIVDILMAFPGVILALLLISAVGPTLPSEIIAIGVSVVPTFARVARGQAVAIRGRLYVDALRALGVGRTRVLIWHVVPNSLSPLIVLATIGIGNAILLGAALSFLGLGPTGGVPDWGRLLASGEPYITTAWWITTFPGLIITLVVISANILGDWLRDRLDVGEVSR